jgi:predicted HTH domain antitoxin
MERKPEEDRMDLRLDLPAEVITLLGSTPEAAAARARQAVVLDLLRDGRISQGKAARALGVTRHDIIDLMAAHQIPSGPLTIAELHEEVESVEQFLRTQPS